jgi:DNA polymerase III subunit epsilon
LSAAVQSTGFARRDLALSFDAAVNEALSQLDVFAIDCQAGGATPDHGDLLELGWARCPASGESEPRSSWIVPRTSRRVGRAVRELTGWSEACVAEAVEDQQAWAALRDEASPSLARAAGIPTVIHFARFELTFLRELHERCGGGPFPFDVICLHAVAARLFPDLPRRNIRALAGFLGHSPSLERRSKGHVEATIHIWRSLVPLLEAAGIGSWTALKVWLEETAATPRSKRRVYPLPAERRRALPDAAGVYRFLRSNGDVLYVGKAVSLRKRVAGHFKGGRGPTNERALELLTQVHDIDCTATASLLEAALLETDEIKRLDPPYNVQLRSGDRRAWFASRDFETAGSTFDGRHALGPLPSERALAPLAALVQLAAGAGASLERRAEALAVPRAFAPDAELFAQGWRDFEREHLSSGPRSARTVFGASLALWLLRGRDEGDVSSEDAAPDAWDLARVRRRLERSLVQTGLLVRRSRWLCLLADADVAFRESDAKLARALLFRQGEIVERFELAAVDALASLPASAQRTWSARRRGFSIASYDRLRVLLTELQRVRADGGELALRIGGHRLAGEVLARWMRGV